MSLVSALQARSGVTCVVGAGGKKSAMYALAERLPEAILTATVRIPIFDAEVERVVVTDSPVDAAMTYTERPLGLVPEREGTDRYLGYDTTVVDTLSDAVDAPILVKADGARMRRFKAPGSHEPQLPSSATTVVPVVSAHVLGEPLSEELVHRVDRVADIAECDPGAELTPPIVARVLTANRGGWKGVPDGATVIPLINMVDTAELETRARSLATEIHDRATVPHVVLTCLRADDPIIATI